LNRQDLKKVKRIVVKVGTSLLTNPDNLVNPDKVSAIVSQLTELREKGLQVILITSGAVGLGLGIMGSTVYPKTLSERQALAAMGQSKLMHMYETLFSPAGIRIGQVILTAQDIHSKSRYMNVRNTLLKLLEFGAIPVVNENDTVSVDEIKFGDNDTLSASAALCVDAGLLVILTDTDGLFDKNPKKFKAAGRISLVERIDERIEGLARGTDKATAIGGMETKIKAARVATHAGIPVVIASGCDPGVLQSVLSGEDTGTFFVPSERGLSQNERWIAHSRKKKGGIVIDDGCRDAVLKRGKSILPVGVKAVKGSFEKGDSIRVYDAAGREIGVGLANYGSKEFKDILGQKFKDEIIHQDNFVVNPGIREKP
jgi:glutamate 5-kinase